MPLPRQHRYIGDRLGSGSGWLEADPADLITDDTPGSGLVAMLRRARPAWMAAAACAQPGAPSMFPEGRGAGARPALAVCSRCPVLDDCREWCLTTQPNPLPHGVAAGMTARKRQAERRRFGVTS